MAKNYFDRYIWLIDLVRRSGHISFEEIDRSWQFSHLNKTRERLPQRTFFNHLDAIFDTFRIEIKCDRSLGYYIANSDVLEGDGVREWLLESLSLNNLLNESSDMRDRILFEKIPSAQRWLSAIVNAMRDGKMLRMTYKSFWRDEPQVYETHPYCLKLFKQRWYMLSKTEGKKEPRTYALDRILELEELPKALKLPKKFSAEGYFSNFFGIIADDTIPPSTVEIKVSADQVKYVESLPLHPSQKAIMETADYTLYHYRLVPTFDFKQEILSRGSTFEVVSPEWFRDEVKEEISAMYKNYGL